MDQREDMLQRDRYGDQFADRPAEEYQDEQPPTPTDATPGDPHRDPAHDGDVHDDTRLDGDVRDDGTLDGDVRDDGTLDGDVHDDGTLDGDVHDDTRLDGDVRDNTVLDDTVLDGQARDEADLTGDPTHDSDHPGDVLDREGADDPATGYATDTAATDTAATDTAAPDGTFMPGDQDAATAAHDGTASSYPAEESDPLAAAPGEDHPGEPDGHLDHTERFDGTGGTADADHSGTAGGDVLVAGAAGATAGATAGAAGTAAADRDMDAADTGAVPEQAKPRAFDDDLTDPVFSDAVSRLREQWGEIQASFVDDPREAVSRAADLVGDAVRTLTEELAACDRALRDSWDGDGHADTERLRQSFRHYRSLLDRLAGI